MSQYVKLLILGICLAIINLLFFCVLKKTPLDVSHLQESAEVEMQTKIQPKVERKKRFDEPPNNSDFDPVRVLDGQYNDINIGGPIPDYELDMTPPGIVFNAGDIPPEGLVDPIRKGVIDPSITPELEISEDEIEPPGLVQ
ncbi:hypothetical protein H8E88_00480 [candidate division KSB1 bacterium]|nr:hypothetical protein [candidate division KSB1 bacterium]